MHERWVAGPEVPCIRRWLPCLPVRPAGHAQLLRGRPGSPSPATCILCHVRSSACCFTGRRTCGCRKRKPGLPLSVPRAPSLSEVISSNWSDPVIAQGSPSSGRAPSTSETSEGIVTLAQKTCGSKATLTAQGGKRRKQTSKCQVPLHCLPSPSCLCGGRKDTCILLGNKEPTLAEKSNTQRQAFLFFFTGGERYFQTFLFFLSSSPCTAKE